MRKPNHLIRIIKTIACEFLVSTPFLVLLGIINRILGKRLNTVFMCYPANQQYVNQVSYSWYAKLRRWEPIFLSIFIHNRGGGLCCAITASESDFLDINNAHHLVAMDQKAKRVARLIGATYVSYASILPAYVARAGVKPLKRRGRANG